DPARSVWTMERRRLPFRWRGGCVRGAGGGPEAIQDRSEANFIAWIFDGRRGSVACGATPSGPVGGGGDRRGDLVAAFRAAWACAISIRDAADLGEHDRLGAEHFQFAARGARWRE